MLEAEAEAATEGDDPMPAKAPKLLVPATLVEARLDVKVVGVVHALVATVGTAEDAAFRCTYDDDDETDADGDMRNDVLRSPGADRPTAAAAAISFSLESYSCSSCWNGVRLLLRLLLRRRPWPDA